MSRSSAKAQPANERAQRLEEEEREERRALREAEQRSFELRRQAIATMGERADEAHRDGQGRDDDGRFD